VTVDSGALTIQAERTPAYREGQPVTVAERSQGSFARQLSLGEGVDSKNLTAAYTDGVLHVTIPASSRSQPRRVEIIHAAGAGPTISGITVDQGDARAPARAPPAEPSVLTSSTSRRCRRRMTRPVGS
jgi:HSP20 family protein